MLPEAFSAVRPCLSCSLLQTKKNLSFQTGFLNMVGERGLPGSASRALRAVAEATLSRCARLKPPLEVLILFLLRRKKTCLFRQVS